MGYIYKITNRINDKFYIGKTELNNPYDRFKEHIHDSKKDRCKNRPLYRAFNKYGFDCFEFKVIEKTDDTENREIYYINLYNANGKNGYNATIGGDGRVRLKLDESKVIEYHTNIANHMAYKTARHFNVDHKTINKILDKNNIMRLTISDVTKLSRDRGIKLAQIDKQTSSIINIFTSISDANYYLGKDREASNIRNVLVGKSKTAYGYTWKIIT